MDAPDDTECFSDCPWWSTEWCDRNHAKVAGIIATDDAGRIAEAEARLYATVAELAPHPNAASTTKQLLTACNDTLRSLLEDFRQLDTWAG